MAGRRGLKADYSVATVSVTLVLLLLGVVGYILINAYSSTSAVRSELRFSVMLADTVTQEQRSLIERRMGMHPAVATWRYISADEAARDFQTYIGTDFVDFLGENPLPASYELTLNPGYADAEELAALETECASWSGVEEVVYQRKIVEAVMRNLNRLNYILLGLGGFLLVVTVMLISNTLRLAVAARRQSIATMRLVGATPGFIRRPFVLRSFTQGVVAGVLASGLLYLFVDGLSEVMPEVKLVCDRETFALLFSAMILAGVLICTTFTALAVNRYVRQTD
ncbi:permease-like cell division protein FtsX [uncultured Rikenella sp.]|uniref:cell division protein FtsX n=1 Tax=uncultured Rikenella sp. TaxID=368003 RepID=UPI002602DB34|nr:permease-like cell division protein FtsX [uncultured Rikenella sp.]